MSRRGFQRLMTEFFRAAGAIDVRTVPGAGLCQFNGLAVAIYHDERTDPHHVDAYIDFGAVPLARQREVFRTLLLRQLNLTPPHRTVVGLDDATDSIVLVARIPFDDGLSGERLACIFGQLIRQVLIWKSPAAPRLLPAARRRSARRPS